jgi:hypothetical protein
LIKPDGSLFTPEELEQELEAVYERNSEGDFYIKHHTRAIPMALILTDWHHMLIAAGPDLINALRKRPGELWRYSKQAADIMRDSGWRGGGIGLHSQGIAEPVALDAAAQASRGEGLGYVNRARGQRYDRRAMRGTIASKDKLRAVTLADNSVKYGVPNKHMQLELVEFTMKGRERRTGEIVDFDPDDLRTVVRWSGKAIGIAEKTWPHPTQWRLGNSDKDLDKLTVKDLTREFAERMRAEPTCVSAWEKRIGALPKSIGTWYNSRLLSPKDWMSHFKNVLHRAMFTNGTSVDEELRGCRMCSLEHENLQHFVHCQHLQPTWDAFATLATGQPLRASTGKEAKERFILFGLPPGKALEEGWKNFLLLIWKATIIALTANALEGEPIHTHSLWAMAWARFKSKTQTKSVMQQARVRRAESRGCEPPDVSGVRVAAPLAEFSERGDITWDPEIQCAIEKMCEAPKKEPRAGQRGRK